MIGMCQVLRAWLRAGVVDDLDVLLLPVEKNNSDKADEILWLVRACEDEVAEERGWG